MSKFLLGCWIKVGDEERTWSVGKLTTLDTSFEHSTGNPTDEDRYVFFVFSKEHHFTFFDDERCG